MYGSWELEHDRQIFLSFWTIFSPFIPLLITPKITILEKWKKSPKISFCTWQSYDVWFLRYEVRLTEFCSYFGSFFALLPLLPTSNLENQAFEKMKKMPGHILNKWTINVNHIMYGSWNMNRNRQNFCHFGPFFCFYCTNQNFEKKKKSPGDILILHKGTKNNDHMLYCSWDMVQDDCNHFSFWAIFCPLTPRTAQKVNICYIVLKICCAANVIVIFHFGLFFSLLPS